MKLYRRQLATFTDQTLVTEKFITDQSREFNHCGKVKNAGKFFFYSITPDGADQYALYSERTGGFIATERVTYEIDSPRLLDLRVPESRALLTETINTLIREQQNVLESLIDTFQKDAVSESKRKGNNRLRRLGQPRMTPKQCLAQVEELKAEYSALTFESVVNNIRKSGLSWWGQRATDFEAGESMRADLERLGYDGIIFIEGNRSSEPEVALLKAARLVCRESDEQKEM